MHGGTPAVHARCRKACIHGVHWHCPACITGRWCQACIWCLIDTLLLSSALTHYFNSCFVRRRCWPFLGFGHRFLRLVSHQWWETRVFVPYCLFGLWGNLRGICSRRKSWVKYWHDPGYHQKYSQIAAHDVYTLRRPSHSPGGEDMIFAALRALVSNDWLRF